jgi:hypothetical protein
MKSKTHIYIKEQIIAYFLYDDEFDKLKNYYIKNNIVIIL